MQPKYQRFGRVGPPRRAATSILGENTRIDTLVVCGVVCFLAIGALQLYAGQSQCVAHSAEPPALPVHRTDFDPREGMFKACRSDASLSPSNLRVLGSWRSKKDSAEESITLVTQLTVERLELLRGQCRAWHDRLAAVVCVPFVAGFGGANMQVPSINGSSEETLIDILFRFHREVETVRSGCILDLELVVQDVASWDDPALTKYPVNAVRNRALQLVRTDGVLLLDADFLPAASLVNSYQASSTAYAALMQQLLLEKAAIVLPAFGHADYQPLPDGTDARMAKDAALLNSKESMALAYSSGIMPSFYEMENPRDHGATNFSRWITATAPYEIVYERMFEPYVLVAKKYVPWFDERFIGYYRNKVEHLEHMYSLGVKYKVHPYAFVLHRPHLKSATFQATEALTGNADHMAKMIRTHEAIQAEIANGTFVPVTSFGHRCPAHVPVEGARIVAVLTEKTKWMRANRAGSTV